MGYIIGHSKLQRDFRSMKGGSVKQKMVWEMFRGKYKGKGVNCAITKLKGEVELTRFRF